MSNPIGFNNLFDKASFDSGVGDLVGIIGKITTEINKAKESANALNTTLGANLKKEIASLSSTSSQLSKNMSEMSAKMEQYKQSVASTDKVISEYEKETERLRKELEKLKAAQDKANNATDQAGKAGKTAKVSYAQLGQSMLGLAGGAALVHRGITLVTEQFKEALKSVIEFEKAMKAVEAISRSSTEQIQALRDNANKLGASTEKTAIQVAGLQKELAKLGFSTAEIIASSSAIVDLATATGEDLAGSAMVVASTLRAFGLEATETVRVVDTMAGSFVRSGLDLEKFRESMKLVAPIARATNVDIETTTASLSKLADAGLSGSLAGTALRNLLSEMADPTSKLSEFLGYTVKSSEDLTRAFTDLSARGVDLAQAVQMVDVRARPAFFILLNQIGAVKNLAKEYKSLTGEGERLASTMRDTLANDIEIANSAFDALRRNLLEGSTGAMREITQDITIMIEGLRLLSEGYLYTSSGVGMFIGELKELGSLLNPITNYLNMMKLIGIDLVDMWEGFKAETARARDVFQEDEWLKKAGGDLNAIRVAVENTKFSPLVSEYNELNKVTNKTETQVTKLKELEKQLLMQYGETAIAIDKVTGKHFLNISAIERTIERSTKEAITIANTNKERIKEIDAKVELHKQTTHTLKLQGKWTDALELELSKSYEINRLLTERSTILKVLGGELEGVADTTSNGWSIYLDGAGKAMTYEQMLAKREEDRKKKIEETNTALEERRKLFDLIAKKSKDIIDQEIRQAGLAEGQEKFESELAKEQKKRSEEFFENLHKEGEEKYKALAEEGAQLKQKIANEMHLGEIKSKQRKEDEKEAKKTADELAKIEEEKWKKIEEYTQLAGQAISNITRSIFDNQALARDNEMNAIDAWEKERIQVAGDNEQAIAKIEREAEERRKQVRIDQAKADKKEAIFQIAIATAVNVAKAGLKFWEIAIILALGAAQAAAVAARPLPQFAKGTDNSPEGHAIVGERGRELIKDGRTGKYRLSEDRASITYLTKGSQVITAEKTQKLISEPNFDHHGVAEKQLSRSTTNRSVQPQIDYNKMAKAFNDSVANIPVNKTVFDEDGVTKFVHRRMSKIQRRNKRY